MRSINSLHNLSETKKRDSIINENVYLLGRQFHRKQAQSGSGNKTAEESSYMFATNISQSSPGASPIKLVRSKQEKIDPILLFQNHFMQSHESDECIQYIKSFSLSGQTLYGLIEAIAYNLKILISYKNEKMAQQIVDRICEYQLKFKQVKQVLLDQIKPKDWTLDLFLKRIILYHTKMQRKKLVLKRKIEPNFFMALVDFNQKLEEVNMRKCEDMYKQISQKIQEHQQKLRDKQLELIKLIHKKKEQNPNARDFLPQRHEANYRLLMSDSLESIHEQESRLGAFYNIKPITRHRSMGINLVVQEMQQM